jgi:tetratricopeptide (TPR) repeat protein
VSVLALRLAEQRDFALSARDKEAIARGQADRANRFLREMLYAANPETAGTPATIQQLLAEGALRLEREPLLDPAVAAQLHETLAIGYRRQNVYAEADKHLRAALELRRGVHEADPALLLGTLTELSSVLLAEGLATEAVPFLTERFDLLHRQLGPLHPGTLAALTTLADVLIGLDRPADLDAPIAATYAAVQSERGSDDAEWLSALLGLAQLEDRCGRMAEAETLYRRAMPLADRIHGVRSEQGFEARHALGGILLKRGRVPEAEGLLRDAWQIAQAVYPAAQWQAAAAQRDYGGALLLAGKLTEAEEQLREAHEALEVALGEAHAETRRVRELLLSLFERTGDATKADEMRELLDAGVVP